MTRALKRPVAERCSNFAVNPLLFPLIGRRIPVEEQELGAEQPASFGAGGNGRMRVLDRTEIGEDFDAYAVGGEAKGQRVPRLGCTRGLALGNELLCFAESFG